MSSLPNKNTPFRLRVGVIVLVCTMSWASGGQPNDLKTYYGLLHAHTLISDGLGTPEEAYSHAKTVGLDFFAVTPHNHAKAEFGAKGQRRDGLMMATNHDLYNSNETLTLVRKWKEGGQPKTETLETVSLVRAAREATNDGFVALYGQEFSTISAGNHVNVFEFEPVITADNGSFSELYEVLRESVTDTGPLPVVQLNHPDVQKDLFYNGQSAETKGKMNNDYGIDDGDLGPEFREMVRVADGFVALIEMLSGPAMKSKKVPDYQYDACENDYYFYLTQGLHVSPTAGQDNHCRLWGDVTDARTGVLCDGLSKENILEAFRSNRTFATEDKDLDLRFSVNGHPMGSIVTLDAGDEVTLAVAVTDQSEPGTGYEVSVYYGTVQQENRDEATDWEASDGLQEKQEHSGNGTLPIDGYICSGDPEFFYVKVRQDDSDRAWSAPIWLNYPKTATGGQEYVWSAKSTAKVYHMPHCKSAKLIKWENRRTGTTAPVDWRKHNCVAAAEEDES
ncbi:MAG: hypothetical protein GY851_05090 [bacterium]|nr:hypothetical protein [bacterium]